MRQSERTRRGRIQEIRRKLIDDSIYRGRLVDDLVKLVRSDERVKTIESLERVRETREERE